MCLSNTTTDVFMRTQTFPVTTRRGVIRVDICVLLRSVLVAR